MSRGHNAAFAGIFLIVLGLFLLARQFNIPLPALETLWPGLIVLLGLSNLADYARRRDSSPLWFGVAATLTGAFLFLFTLNLRLPLPGLTDGVRWQDMERLWPGFVLIAGMAWLAQWLAQPANRGARNLALLAIVVGGIGLAYTLRLADARGIDQIVRLWPALLIAAGLQLVWQYVRRPKQQ